MVITAAGETVAKLFLCCATFVEGRSSKRTDDRLTDAFKDFLNSDRIVIRATACFAMLFEFVVVLSGRALFACLPTASNPASPIFVFSYTCPLIALILLVWSFVTQRLPLSRVRTLNNMSFWAAFAGLVSHAYYATQIDGARRTATLVFVVADLLNVLVHATLKDIRTLNRFRSGRRWQLEIVSAMSWATLVVGANTFR